MKVKGIDGGIYFVEVELIPGRGVAITVGAEVGSMSCAIISTSNWEKLKNADLLKETKA